MQRFFSTLTVLPGTIQITFHASFIEPSQQPYVLGNRNAVLQGVRKLSNLGAVQNV